VPLLVARSFMLRSTSKAISHLLVIIIILTIFTTRRRDEKWNAMSKEQKEHYLATTSDEGNKRLDFRFTH
jgi:hypothetical protein